MKEGLMSDPHNFFPNRILETKDFLNSAEQEDPTMFVSEKTQRGPLDENWLEEYSAACLVGFPSGSSRSAKKTSNQKRILMTLGDSPLTFFELAVS